MTLSITINLLTYWEKKQEWSRYFTWKQNKRGRKITLHKKACRLGVFLRRCVLVYNVFDVLERKSDIFYVKRCIFDVKVIDLWRQVPSQVPLNICTINRDVISAASKVERFERYISVPFPCAFVSNLVLKYDFNIFQKRTLQIL